MVEMKLCNKYEAVSPKTDFYKNKKIKDGHLSACKKSSRYYKKQYLQQHKENINEYKKNKLRTELKQMLIFV